MRYFSFIEPTKSNLLLRTYCICLAEQLMLSIEELTLIMDYFAWDLRTVLLHIQCWCHSPRTFDYFSLFISNSNHNSKHTQNNNHFFLIKNLLPSPNYISIDSNILTIIENNLISLCAGIQSNNAIQKQKIIKINNVCENMRKDDCNMQIDLCVCQNKTTNNASLARVSSCCVAQS